MNWLLPSTWLWHTLRLTLHVEKAATRFTRAVRFYLGWTCGATRPAMYGGRWERCWLQHRHPGVDHQAPDEFGGIVSWPGHPAGTARPGASR